MNYKVIYGKNDLVYTGFLALPGKLYQKNELTQDYDTEYKLLHEKHTLSKYFNITPFVVIDSLCDDGKTFASVASILKEIAPKRGLAIFVTHMVNPKGIATLVDNYNEVYFTNSYFNWENLELPEKVSVIKVV